MKVIAELLVKFLRPKYDIWGDRPRAPNKNCVFSLTYKVRLYVIGTTIEFLRLSRYLLLCAPIRAMVLRWLSCYEQDLYTDLAIIQVI